MAQLPVAVAVTWEADLRFTGSTSGGDIILDGDSTAGPSPMDLLALSLAGCMAIDVVDIITKGRHPLTDLEARVVGERAEVPPRRYVRITLQFLVGGDVPPAAIERAITLSREKYCSVWHSLKPDIELLTSYEVAS
jgi:putative redox protein